VIDRAPQIDHLAVQFHVHLVEMPLPLPEAAHPVNPLPPDVGSEQRTEAVPLQPHCLMAQVDAALKQQVLNNSEAQREPNVHHYN
jgi:hypothetical protein